MKNKTRVRGSDCPPLPAAAECEIMERLSRKMQISGDEIAAILKKHGVSGDTEALQNAYRKLSGLCDDASSIRDENGKREVLSINGAEYVVIDCCNDPRQLKAIRHRIESQMTGLDVSAAKVRGRIRFLDRIGPRKQG